MLEQMGESTTADFLFLGADPIPGIDGNLGLAVILMQDDSQTVLELEALVGNFLGKCGRGRSKQNDRA